MIKDKKKTVICETKRNYLPGLLVQSSLIKWWTDWFTLPLGAWRFRFPFRKLQMSILQISHFECNSHIKDFEFIMQITVIQ